MSNYNIMRKFKRVAKIWTDFEKRPHNFNGQIVYHAEVYMLMHIANNPEISITGLAKVMEITKGTVSEGVKKLEKKGFIVKGKASDNASRMTLKLSSKGKKIVEFHDKIHENAEINFKKYNEQLSEEKKKHIYEFLLDFENFLEEVKSKID